MCKKIVEVLSLFAPTPNLNDGWRPFIILIFILSFRYLKFLNLSYNCIKKINYSLPCALVEINLAHNCITDLRLNMSLSMCEILDVSHNQLKYLNFLKVSYYNKILIILSFDIVTVRFYLFQVFKIVLKIK